MKKKLITAVLAVTMAVEMCIRDRYWGKHRHVMGKGSEWWESLKIGGGAAPIETSEGWLLFYHRCV